MIIRCLESNDWSFTVFTTSDYVHDTGSSFTVFAALDLPTIHYPLVVVLVRCTGWSFTVFTTPDPLIVHYPLVVHCVRCTGGSLHRTGWSSIVFTTPDGRSVFAAPNPLVVHCILYTVQCSSHHMVVHCVRCSGPAGLSLPAGRSSCSLHRTGWYFIVLTTPDPLVVHCVRCWSSITRGVIVHCIHYGPLNRTRWSCIIYWSFTVLTTSDPLVVDVHCVLFTGSAGGR
jgi:hypothetical protein